ncbi:MAG: SMC family ATPase [Chloroflexi bacterium]|nr:SMC family ATPase [Chloroflexota bacterium]
MKPIRLELKNFLPYQVPDPLRFDGIHLACLTGPNGAGKSSVLDAITWVLWGTARSKRDDELIHQGQTEMHVQFDFEQDDVLYRVIRRRSKKGKTGSTELTLLAMNDEQWNLISEPSIRQTEKKIVDILHLSYDTFVHSAFLQQGRADAFTTRTPAERKSILGEILGLEQWLKYEAAAKERYNALEREVDLNRREIESIEIELARRPSLEADKALAEASVREAEEALALAQQRLDVVRDAPDALRRAQADRKDRVDRELDLKRQQDEAEHEMARWAGEIDECLQIVARRADIEGGYDSLQSAREADRSLRDKLDALTDIDRKRADLNSQLNTIRARLDAEIERLERSIDDQQAVIDADPSAELESVQAELRALNEAEARRADMQREETRIREEIAEHKARLETVGQEGKDMVERQAKLEATDSATCPLCGQELTPEHRAEMLAQLEVDIVAHRERYRASRDRAKELDDRLKQQERELKQLTATLAGMAKLQERAGHLSASAAAVAQAAGRKAEDAQQLETLIAQRDTGDYGYDVREALAALDAEAAALGYDKGEHDATRRTLDDYMQYERLKVRLESALEQLPKFEQSRANAEARRDRLALNLSTLAGEIEQIDIQLAGLEERAREYAEREAERRMQDNVRIQATGRLAKIEQQLDTLDSRLERRAYLEEKLAADQHEMGLYAELRTAFGRNGVPAMIIESAIPELEELSNDLLRRMTEGRMALRLITQKDKVTGGVAETLDIEIADELGTRSYETYSGGEAFRINFALRVALSKLLARRAGAQLRTLFIDEGFGTQDETGRARLVEAINTIQHEFELILVITHIDDLRDSFPVHIVVDKTSAGSRISIR